MPTWKALPTASIRTCTCGSSPATAAKRSQRRNRRLHPLAALAVGGRKVLFENPHPVGATTRAGGVLFLEGPEFRWQPGGWQVARTRQPCPAGAATRGIPTDVNVISIVFNRGSDASCRSRDPDAAEAPYRGHPREVINCASAYGGRWPSCYAGSSRCSRLRLKAPAEIASQ